MVNVGSSQESSLRVNSELSILITVRVSQITVPLSAGGGRVCHVRRG